MISYHIQTLTFQAMSPDFFQGGLVPYPASKFAFGSSPISFVANRTNSRHSHAGFQILLRHALSVPLPNISYHSLS